MKHLWVLRHAKAEADSPTGSDHDRRLTLRGKGQLVDVATVGVPAATAAGAALPALVLSSSALRALDTALGILPALGEPDLFGDRSLYLADPDDVVDRLRLLEDDLDSVLVVGHNPTLHELIVLLGSGSGPGAGSGEVPVPEAFPTAALAVLELDIDIWPGLSAGCGRLLSSSTPGRG